MTSCPLKKPVSDPTAASTRSCSLPPSTALETLDFANSDIGGGGCRDRLSPISEASCVWRVTTFSRRFGLSVTMLVDSRADFGIVAMARVQGVLLGN